jgi:cyanophycinase-like exopeptidase
LCVKERWRGEIRVGSTSNVAAMMSLWKRSDCAISCDVRLGNGEAGIK